MVKLKCMQAWNRACDFSIAELSSFNTCTDLTLRAQLVRNLLALPTLIAKASPERLRKPNVEWLLAASETAAELRTNLYIARETNCLTSAVADGGIRESLRLSELLHELIGELIRELPQEWKREFGQPQRVRAPIDRPKMTESKR